MKYHILRGVLMLALCCAYADLSKADNIHLCPNGVTDCSAGTTIPIGPSVTTAYVWGNVPVPNEALFLALATPEPGNSGNWKGSVNFWTLLNFDGAVNPPQPKLSPTLSQEMTLISSQSLNLGFTPGSFNVTDISLKKWIQDPQSFSVPGGLAPGTLLIGFTAVDLGGSHLVADAVTPFSSTLGTTGPPTPPPPVPEPSMILLFGAALLGALVLKRTRA
jgi:PEP-CTERM motif